VRRIYESVFSTVTWLGKSWEALALTAIKKLAAASPAEGKVALAKDLGPYSNCEEFTKHRNLPKKSSSELREFGNLLRNPWFTRAWLFQEVLASDLVDMRCGQYTITYPEFYRVCLSIDFYGLKGDIETINDATFAIHTGSLHESVMWRRIWIFPEWLFSACSCSRRIRKRRILEIRFSHVLESRMTAVILQADYPKDVNNVCVEVAMHLLTYTDPHFLVKSLVYSITHQRKGVCQRLSLGLAS
jgi:hypothetical protein